MSRSQVARVVSGGQSGVDRAGLDAAIAAEVAYGGWCPRGGWAEDLPNPPGLLAHYPLLREAPSADPDVRTHLNVRDSHASLIVRAAQTVSPGTDATIAAAERLGRPVLVSGDPDRVRAWLDGLGRELTLNIAGPRASEQPDAYDLTRALLDRLLRDPHDGT